MLKKNILGLCLLFSMNSFGFDLEDYATTYRATRDAYLKAANELKLAVGPYKSARDSYKDAARTYLKGLGNGKDELDQAKLAEKDRVCVFSADLADRSKDNVNFTVDSLPDMLPEVDEQLLIDQEKTARQEYFDALVSLQNAGKAKSAAVQAYKKATNEYLHSLSTPVDMTLIKRTEILNKK